MDIQTFIQKHRVLQDELISVQNKISLLKREYVKSLPFKEGDVVIIGSQRGTIKDIEVSPYTPQCLRLTLYPFKKDGGVSRRPFKVYGVRIEDIVKDE